MAQNREIRFATGVYFDNMVDFATKWQNYLDKRISGYSYKEACCIEDITYYEPANDVSFWNHNGYLRTVKRTSASPSMSSSIFVDYKKNLQAEDKRYKLNIMPTPFDLARNFDIKKKLEPSIKLSSKNYHLYFTNIEHRLLGGGPYFELIIQNVAIDDKNAKQMSMVTLVDRTKDKYSVVAKSFENDIDKIFDLFRNFMSKSILIEYGSHQTHYDIYSCYSSCLDKFLPF